MSRPDLLLGPLFLRQPFSVQHASHDLSFKPPEPPSASSTSASLGEQQSPTSQPNARHPSPQFQRGWASRSRRNTVPSNVTGLTAKCTKCGISFPDALRLCKHFVESPAHPYSVRPPSNGWEPPAFMEYTTEPTWRKTQPLHTEPKTRLHLHLSSGSGNVPKVKCECGKTFGTNSSLEQHKKDSMKHKSRTGTGVAVKTQPRGEGVSGRSKDWARAWANDGIDDIASAFAKLFIAR